MLMALVSYPIMLTGDKDTEEKLTLTGNLVSSPGLGF